MILYIVRHAWAEEADETRWPDDAQRPLTDEGCKRFAKMVKVLADRGLAPAVVATSPLVRCRQTAEIIARQIAGKPRLVPRDELSPGSDLDKLLAWTAPYAADEEQFAWVGHAPDVGELAAALIGDGSANLVFAKGALAAIEFDGHPTRRQGELRWLVTAKILGC
jgi:phosphohistidine phosphatase